CARARDPRHRRDLSRRDAARVRDDVVPPVARVVRGRAKPGELCGSPDRGRPRPRLPVRGLPQAVGLHMACARCAADVETASPRTGGGGGEAAYDPWIRRHASDIIAPVVAGMVVIAGLGLGLPLLGADWVAAASAVFAGFGTLIGLFRLSRRRRRRQFLLAS